MFFFRHNLKQINFDLAGYKRKLLQDMSEVLGLAAFYWITEATGTIPVWSGASHGTFLPLAQEAGINLSIDPVAARRVFYGVRTSDGDFKLDSDKGEFFFTYETELPHLVWNEYNNANTNPDATLFARLKNPGPYNFQDKAQKAFFQVMVDARLPDPRPFFKTTRAS